MEELSPWVTLVCMFVRSPCLHTMTVVHAVLISAHKLPPWWFFFHPGMQAQGRQLSFDFWITSRSVILTTFLQYACSAVRSLIPPAMSEWRITDSDASFRDVRDNQADTSTG